LGNSTFEDGSWYEKVFAEGDKARVILEENGSRVTEVSTKSVE
jgi:hypothetical protein